jgi:protein lin-9
MSEEDSHKEDSPEEASDSDKDPSFGPASLGLHRVGTAPPKKKRTPLQKLNARGRPARIRKKNSKYDDENEEEPKSPAKGSPKKGAASPTKAPASALKATEGPRRRGRKRLASREEEEQEEEVEQDEEEEDEDEEMESDVSEEKPPPKKRGPKKKSITNQKLEAQLLSTIDKKACQRVGLRLRNLLKLPKAHKFVMYEFFYSSIDRSIFLGTNDFELALVEHFPRLKTRTMTKTEWNFIRRTMGKPRRLSTKFFEEERLQLERNRQKIRLLQSRKVGDFSFVCDLPNEIPVPFSIGTKVTARLRSPQDGLFSGSIESLIHKSHSYRIAFERQGIGSQEIPDFEVMSNEAPMLISVEQITKEFASRPDVSYYMVSPLRPTGARSSIFNNGSSSFRRGDPMMSSASVIGSATKLERYQKPKPQTLVLPTSGSIGGYPVKLLEAMILVRKTMEVKHMQLLKIRRLNVEAEVVKSFGDNAPDDFQKKYAALLVEMERINRDLADYMNMLQAQADMFVDDAEELQIITPTYLREKCRDLATQTFVKNNTNNIKDSTMTKLIGNLATIMWVTSNLKNDQYSNVEEVLATVLLETSKSLEEENLDVFQKSVETHIQQIQLGIFDENTSQAQEIEILEEDYVLGE